MNSFNVLQMEWLRRETITEISLIIPGSAQHEPSVPANIQILIGAPTVKSIKFCFMPLFIHAEQSFKRRERRDRMQRVGKITRMLNLAPGNAGRINKMNFFRYLLLPLSASPFISPNFFPHFVLAKPAIWRTYLPFCS